MEETLTLEELYLLISSKHKADHEERRFLAGLEGVDLGDYAPHKETFEDIKKKAQAQLAGISEQEYVLTDIIEFDDEEEVYD
jgi:hypothetical protein